MDHLIQQNMVDLFLNASMFVYVKSNPLTSAGFNFSFFQMS
jgi:hypothetical protein